MGGNAGGGWPQNGGLSWEQSCGKLHTCCHEYCKYSIIIVLLRYRYRHQQWSDDCQPVSLYTDFRWSSSLMCLYKCCVSSFEMLCPSCKSLQLLLVWGSLKSMLHWAEIRWLTWLLDNRPFTCLEKLLVGVRRRIQPRTQKETKLGLNKKQGVYYGRLDMTTKIKQKANSRVEN